MVKIYVIVAQINYDIDGEYIVIKAFFDQKVANDFCDRFENEPKLKYIYHIRDEFNSFEVNECELE